MRPYSRVLQVEMVAYYGVLPLLQSFLGTFVRKILSIKRKLQRQGLGCMNMDMKEILDFKFSSNKLINIRIPKQLISIVKY